MLFARCESTPIQKKKKKNMEEGERVELTLSCSVKLLTQCVGDIVPECVENIRLTILW